MTKTSTTGSSLAFSPRPHSSTRHDRPSSLRTAMAIGLCLAFGFAAAPALAANWWTPTPVLVIGSATVNVRDAGAYGDGLHNDTAAIQAAINSLPTDGGTVVVPAGRYMIDALKSINLRSHTRLKMDPAAQLVAIPNDKTRYYVIKVWNVNNVEIVGGAVVGERATHVGDTGEWGMGLDIMASNMVSVHDFNVANCWGDGIYIGALGSADHVVPSTDITLNHVTSSNNRRQGLSFGPVQRVYIVKSTFANSNGTAPQAGIDIEPSVQGSSQNIRIEGSYLTGNEGSGIEVQANVSGLVIKWSTIKGNTGFGVFTNAASNIAVAGNTITENGLFGVSLRTTTHDATIVDNKITYNSTRGFYAHNKSIYQLVWGARDLEVVDTTWNIHAARNTISPTP